MTEVATAIPAVRVGHVAEVAPAPNLDEAQRLAERLRDRAARDLSGYAAALRAALGPFGSGFVDVRERAGDNVVVRTESTTVVVDYPALLTVPSSGLDIEARACLAICAAQGHPDGPRRTKAWARATPSDTDRPSPRPLDSIPPAIERHRAAASALAQWLLDEFVAACAEDSRRVATTNSVDIATLATSDLAVGEYLSNLEDPYLMASDVLARPGAEECLRRYLACLLALPDSLQDPREKGVEFLWLSVPLSVQRADGVSEMRDALYLIREQGPAARIGGVTYADPSDPNVSKRSSRKLARHLGIRL